MNQQHGGSRARAGRKVGSVSKKSSAIAKAAAALGIGPVEVMLQIMRKAHAEGEVSVALGVAKSAAPYVSPRLSSIAFNLGDLSESELRTLAE